MGAIAGLRAGSVAQERVRPRTNRQRLKGLSGVVMILAAVAAGAIVPSASAQKLPAVSPTQELAMLLSPHKVVASLRSRRTVATIRAWGPVTGEETVLPVTRQTTTRDGSHWLRVLVPGRPNGRQGWITERATVLSTTSWHLVVRTSTRQVLVYGHGRLVRSFLAVVGKPSTPTPDGRFFVEESVLMLPGSAGAPFALLLSARSDVLQEFEGGPGQVAIHGLENLGGIPGTAMSHGCIRLDTQDITWLANRIAPGTPVTIVR